MLKLKTLFVLTMIIGVSALSFGCVKGASYYDQAPNETLVTTDVYYDQMYGPTGRIPAHND